MSQKDAVKEKIVSPQEDSRKTQNAAQSGTFYFFIKI